jgi:peroxiredoxin
MKKIAFIFLAALAISCQEEEKKEDLTFKGNVKDVENGTEVYLAELGENGRPVPVDTVQVNEGSFELDLPKVDFQTLSILSFKGLRGNIIFINENEAITSTVYKDSLRSSTIEGGKQNKLFQDYVAMIKTSGEKMQELNAKYKAMGPEAMKNPKTIANVKAEQKAIQDEDAKKREEFIKENPNSLVSILIISDLINTKSVETNKAKELYNSLSKNVQNSRIGKSVNEALQKASATAIGSKAPDFSAPTPDGEQLSLKEAMGKVTIIDFWASWCKPCRIENPNVVKLYNEYHEKGLNIIGVSLDKTGQREKWLKAIEDDGLSWHHVSNLKFWNGPVAQLYKIKSIPATYILDEKGVIIAKNLRGDALRAKVSEMLD